MREAAASTEYSLGLTGWPLEHSLSPALHQAALAAAGLSGEYRLYPVHPTKPGELRDLLERMRRGQLHGLNVTVPHKRTAVRYLDALTREARQLGAVNAIARDGDRLLGANTDLPAFLFDLERSLAPSRGTAIVLGAGGAARAAVFGLAREGWTLHVAARRLDQAERLANELGSALGDERSSITPAPLTPTSLARLSSSCGLIVNCTPLGMAPEVGGCPWPAEVALPAGAAVYDLVYNPVETVLVRAARARGLPAANGMGMLLEQAALSFERWTGRRADQAAMRAALESALERRGTEGSAIMTERDET